MPRKCSICVHQRKDEINHALIGSESQASIAVRFGLAESSVSRHRSSHLVPRLATAMARYEDIGVERLTAWLNGLNEMTLSALIKAKADEDWANFRLLVAESRKNFELIGKLTGVLTETPMVTIDARKQFAVLERLSELPDDALLALAGLEAGSARLPVIEV